MTILFTVTNDLSYDQRMHRICGALASKGHEVILIGRDLPGSIPLEIKPFHQKRLHCWFRKGFLFYAEFNVRLFGHLLFAGYDAVCSVDLDTLFAGCMASLIRRKKRVFDAHEYFTEVPEVVNRPFVRSFWAAIARSCLPFYQHAYTVGPALAQIFETQYGLKFGVVRNVPNSLETPTKAPEFNQPKILLYQGALNEGRGIEALLEAMQSLDQLRLVLAGEGDLSEQLRQKARDLNLDSKVEFLGYVKPEDLKKWTAQAWLGLNLLENKGQSYYYSLANKFFDCVQAGVPVLTMDFPEYRALNADFEVALLLKELKVEAMVSEIQNLLNDKDLYLKLHKNCLLAKEHWNWEIEQKALFQIWDEVMEVAP